MKTLKNTTNKYHDLTKMAYLLKIWHVCKDIYWYGRLKFFIGLMIIASIGENMVK
jgi:hypothetical protein